MHAVAAQVSQLSKMPRHTVWPITQQVVAGWQPLNGVCQGVARAARCAQAGHGTTRLPQPQAFERQRDAGLAHASCRLQLGCSQL